MYKTNPKKSLILLSSLMTCLFVAYILTARYFPIEADAANSPLVWRSFLNEGFSAFKDWSPTADNWYFTTYPVNFLFFTLFNDGKSALILSTSFFIGATSFLLTLVIHSINKSKLSLIALISLVSLPAYVYIFGFAAHPFSHYSTNFFGVLTFSLAFYNLNKRSLSLTLTYTLIAVLASASDPWFQATYFLPLALVHGFFSLRKQTPIKITSIFSIGFIISMTHLLPKALGLPIQRFKLVPYEQWLSNAEWVINVLGKSLNLFFVDTKIAHTLSLLIWVVAFLYALKICLGQGKESIFVSLFSFLTISAIISSFIISYDSPADISARFFVNAVCFFIALTVLGVSFSKNKALFCFLLLYIASSLYSYHTNKSPLYDQEKQTYEFIEFLNKNNLKFGYGDYWRFSNSVNWLAKGEIHIAPVLFDESTHRINFNKARVQTMKSWLTDDYIKDAPNRQFVSIPAVESTEPNAAGNIQLSAIRNQLGDPDETLLFQGMTIFIYNKKIPLR